MIKVVFCLPGKSFSNLFLESWTNLLLACPDFGIFPVAKAAYNPNIYRVRNLCLEGDQKFGSDQKPFGGKINYDYIMWIDSDSVFTPQQFRTLIDRMEKDKNLNILSGVYLSAEGKEYTAGKAVKTGQPNSPLDVRFLTPQDLKGKSNLIEVDFNGLGFMLIRRGVFESLTYPWFYPIVLGNSPQVAGFTSEDVGFCIRAKEKGYPTFIDPKVIIGHEKSVVLK